MKSLSQSFLFVCSFVTLFACKKSNDTTPTPVVPVPQPFVYGSFYIERTEQRDTYSTGTPPIQLMATIFIDSSLGNYVTNGFLTLNNDTLYYTYGTYYNMHGDLDSSGGYNWMMKATAYTPVISFHQSSILPEYTGSLPDTIALVNGLSLDVSSTTTSDADSVGLNFGGDIPRQLFSVSNGTFNLSSNELFTHLYSGSNNVNGWHTLCFFLFKFDTTVINGKHYKFAKVHQIQKQVHIL